MQLIAGGKQNTNQNCQQKPPAHFPGNRQTDAHDTGAQQKVKGEMGDFPQNQVASFYLFRRQMNPNPAQQDLRQPPAELIGCAGRLGGKQKNYPHQCACQKNQRCPQPHRFPHSKSFRPAANS